MVGLRVTDWVDAFMGVCFGYVVGKYRGVIVVSDVLLGISKIEYFDTVRRVVVVA